MADLEMYALVDRNGHRGDHLFRTFRGAQELAGRDHAVEALKYELVDAEVVETPNGEENWPPGKTPAKGEGE